MIGAALYQNFASSDRKASGYIEEAARPGFRAPSFELTGLNGETYRVGGERERPLLLNFWASWCGPCHLEADDLQKLYEQYEGKLDIYGVNVTSIDTLNGARRFVDDYRLTFPIPLDEDGTAAQLYKVDGYPTSFLIDSSGVIVDAVFGIVNPMEIQRAVDGLLASGESK